MDATRPRALALLSGGLDSSLAVRVLLEQGVPVTALHFVSVFSGGRTADGRLRARAVADELGVPLVVRDATSAMLEFVPKPRFGWGRHLNPCIDCHSFQISVAKGMLEETGASFVVTGEVLGQRPMSQNCESLGRVAKASGMNGLLLRPLSALRLDPTTPEEKGWVDRSGLLGIS
ncbi:MAG: adenine nucleotide alpha hydrolase family protein, partial [Planctomycetota bacterium]